MNNKRYVLINGLMMLLSVPPSLLSIFPPLSQTPSVTSVSSNESVDVRFWVVVQPMRNNFLTCTQSSLQITPLSGYWASTVYSTICRWNLLCLMVKQLSTSGSRTGGVRYPTCLTHKFKHFPAKVYLFITFVWMYGSVSYLSGDGQLNLTELWHTGHPDAIISSRRLYSVRLNHRFRTNLDRCQSIGEPLSSD